MSENMQFPIPNSVLEPYIKSAVSTAITAALGDGAKLVEAAVAQALTAKVNSSGTRSSYDYENKYQLVEVLARDLLDAVLIKASIEKQLKNKHSAIAQALVEGLIKSLSTSWNVKVDITAPRDN